MRLACPLPSSGTLYRADAVILALPSAALKSSVTENIHQHQDKILIDATNSTTRNEALDSMLCMTNMCSVKAFKDSGAVDVLLNKPCEQSHSCRHPQAVWRGDEPWPGCRTRVTPALSCTRTLSARNG
jgi:hypothetical protein